MKRFLYFYILFNLSTAFASEKDALKLKGVIRETMDVDFERMIEAYRSSKKGHQPSIEMLAKSILIKTIINSKRKYRIGLFRNKSLYQGGKLIFIKRENGRMIHEIRFKRPLAQVKRPLTINITSN